MKHEHFGFGKRARFNTEGEKREKKREKINVEESICWKNCTLTMKDFLSCQNKCILGASKYLRHLQ